MPMLQMMLGRLNRLFSEPDIQGFRERRELFAQGRRLSDIAREVRTAPSEILNQWAGFLDSMPVSIQETVRAVIYSALSSNPPVAVTFAWAPAYDFEVTVWQAPDSRTTRGGITVLLKSRYPGDRHPLT